MQGNFVAERVEMQLSCYCWLGIYINFHVSSSLESGKPKVQCSVQSGMWIYEYEGRLNIHLDSSVLCGWSVEAIQRKMIFLNWALFVVHILERSKSLVEILD